MTNGASREERLRRQHGMREPERLVLEDVGDLDAEPRAVAGGRLDLLAGFRGDDDADLLDAGGGHRLDAVEQHRLVGDRHELLRARVRDRAQARALAPRQDEPPELLHGAQRTWARRDVLPTLPANVRRYAVGVVAVARRKCWRRIAAEPKPQRRATVSTGSVASLQQPARLVDPLRVQPACSGVVPVSARKRRLNVRSLVQAWRGELLRP